MLHLQGHHTVASLVDTPDHPAPKRTQALIKAESLEVVQLVLPAGARLPEHAAPGEITLFGLAGTLILELQGQSLHIGPGDFIHLRRGERHAVVAEAPARALLTICLHREPPAPRSIHLTRRKEPPCT